MPADARRRRRRASSQGLYRWADGARAARRTRATILFSGTGPGRGPGGRRPSWPSTTTSAPSCGRPRRTSALREEALAAERWNRLHPDRAAAHAAASPSCSPTPTGPVVAVTDFMKAVPDQIARWVPRRRSCRSAPTASAAPTPARRCAASSRSTPPTSSSPCCRRWPRQGEVKAEVVADAIARYGIDPALRPALPDPRRAADHRSSDLRQQTQRERAAGPAARPRSVRAAAGCRRRRCG